MQYKQSKKIIIDKRKLDTLIRLNCPDDRILSIIKTGIFEPTQDELLDETLESLIDIKEFQNWGGSRPNAGRKQSKINQDENQLDNQDENQDTNQVVDKDIDKDIDKDKDKNKIKNKIKINDVIDYNSLFTYWEENKKGGKYKNEDSKNRMLDKLKKLTNNDFCFAKEVIMFCIDSNYQGFCSGDELYYKRKKQTAMTNEDGIIW